MGNPNVVVDAVSSLSPSAKDLAARAGQPPQVVTVNFKGGRSGLLDMASPRSAVWADVLDSLAQADVSAYVEIDPATKVITELLIPLAVKVESLTPTAAGDAIEVSLLISHARHYLRRTNPDFQTLLTAVESARDRGTEVLVTETADGSEIIDVRPAPKARPPAEEAVAPPISARPAPTPVTLEKAQQLFGSMSAMSCAPATAPAPCIPFMYPDDGCWGRAHEMCRLIIAGGVQPAKVWIYGVLRALTRNNPACEVNWGWHVAPTLLVASGTASEPYVIDPSLFSCPVPTAKWASVQGDPAAAVEPSDAAAFYRSKGGAYVEYDDAAYSKTQQVLVTYRNKLKLRSASSVGPPPYAKCPEVLAGNPALVQSRFGTKGNFELVVPLAGGGMAFYWRNNDVASHPWNGPFPFGQASCCVDALSLIQSDFGSPGNLEVAARQGNKLLHLWRDSGPAFKWNGPFAFGTAGVSGNPALIQSRFGTKGNFELVVPLAAGGMALYWRNNDAPGLPWNGPFAFGQATGKIDAVALIQSNFGSPGNLEVVARQGNKLLHFWRDSGPAFKWNGPFPIP